MTQSNGLTSISITERNTEGGIDLDNIGVRAAKEICNRIDSEHELYDLLGEIELTRASLFQWQKKKHVPGGKALRRMAFAGYDINYILTGERK
jgi:hypothetical protein